jgi:serine/threonine protein kinase/DNA-binding LacI/PurR family transcriptional regulator
MSSHNYIGTQIGEFTVLQAIGRGGMATVYRASQPLMNREVALKVISLDDVADKNRDFATRFATEASLIASLEHPNILPVYSYGITDKVAYLAMRLLRGGSLDDRLRGEPLPLATALDLFNQIAQGLAHAHSKGIIHRDIKPSNILLDESGHAYLTDFGLAKLIDADAGMTKPGQIMGTPVYMSPEQLRGEPLDYRSDVYALGCLLYEMLIGTPPFPPVDGDVIPVIFKHLQTPPDAPTGHNPYVPPALDGVVLRALAKSPGERFESVRELATAVRQAVGGLPSMNLPRPANNIVNRTVPLSTVQQKRANLWIGFTVSLLLVVVAAVLFIRPLNQPPVQFDPAQILVGEEAPLESLLPDTSDVATARQALGSNGFIAIIPCNTSSEYHAALVRELASFARETGLETRVYDPDSDAYKQLTLLERAIADGVRGIILCPLDLELIGPTMEEVKRAKIPFVSQASNMGQYGGVQILTDNRLLGRKPGEYVGQVVRDELSGEAKVVVMGFEDLPDLITRADAMVEALLEYAPNAEIVARVRGATPEWGKESIEALLAEGVEFNVILSINDAGAFGALEALEAAGVPYDDVIIGSVDAEILAQRYIRDGKYFRGTVEAGRTVYASAAIDVIIKLLAGDTIPEFVFIPPGELITRETLAEAP